MRLASIGLLLISLLNTGFGEGTETLGEANLSLASGSGFIGAGTGLSSGSGTIDVVVPGEVKQVLLYWSGSVIGDMPSDNTLVIDGQVVEGTLIGGPTFFFDFEGLFFASSYRADITDLDLVSQGSNSLSVSGLDDEQSSGAGLLVIYDDGTPAIDFGLTDGLDIAFPDFPEPRQTTVPQTFSVTPSAVDRTGGVTLLVACLDKASDVRVTVGGQVTEYLNALSSNDGPFWDSLNVVFPIPAGASEVTVEVLTTSNGVPAQASPCWIAAAVSTEVAITPPPSDNTPPTVTCEFERLTRFCKRVRFDASDAEGEVSVEASIDFGCVQIPVSDGDLVKGLRFRNFCRLRIFPCFIFFISPQAELVVTATDEAGNVSTCTDSFR